MTNQSATGDQQDPTTGTEDPTTAPERAPEPTEVSEPTHSTPAGDGDELLDDAASGVVVPDDISSLDESSWTSDDYAPVITGSGAIKLHMSEVAPLVAAAHGFRTLDSGNVKSASGDYPLDISGSRQLSKSIGNGDAMMMPWYRMDDVFQTGNQRKNKGVAIEPPIGSMQWRPSHPMPNADGKLAKYVIAKGQPSVMGVHPALPPSWFEGTWPVMICEGAIKADSALTALLVDAGIPSEDLKLTDAEKAMTAPEAITSARERLRSILESIPESKRFLIITLIGVGNWHSLPEWNAVKLGNRVTMVAFDGDVGHNINVWKQASALQKFVENKQGTFALVNVPSVPGEEKPGVDDYLATKSGTWSNLIQATSSAMPTMPSAGEVVKIGDWRVNDQTSACEEYSSVSDALGNVREEWVPRINLAGRIKAIEKARSSTEDELRTGVFDVAADQNALGRVEVEVSWLDEDGKQHRAIVEGQSDILADPPEMWHRRNGTSLPATVSSLPQWPADRKWLQAIKGHRRDDIDLSSVWYSMGWVPVPGSIPVFIAGQDVVGADGLCSDALPGVTEKLLSGADRFGLNPPDVDNFDEEVREAIEEVVSTYTGGAWLKRGVAAIALATAMRPCLPLSPHAVLMLTGARRSGKALPLDESIELSNGNTTTVGHLEVGDHVLASDDGSPTKVRGLSQISEEDIYEVVLAAGGTLRASDRHMFKVYTDDSALGYVLPDWEGSWFDPKVYRSGQAIMLPELAAATGLDLDTLSEAVEAAGVPHEEVQVSLGHEAFGIVVETRTVYPLGEALEVVNWLASGRTSPGFRTITSAQMLRMVENGEDFWLNRRGTLVGVKAVRAAGRAQVRCITVDHWSGCFLAGDDVPSHNSWTAEAIMGFWQKKPGNFSGSLPGTAGDTKYAIENAIAKTHIWVADDVAPSVDQRKAQATEGKIGSLIRDVHNRSATRRMSADGTAREQLMPRAMFIVTAENAQAASSEMDRVIHVVAGEKFLGTHEATDAVRNLNKKSVTTNKVATAAIMMIARMARENGWSDVMQYWHNELNSQNAAAASRMGNGEKVARHSGMAADLAMGLSVLAELAASVGCSDETLDAISEMFNEMFDYVRIGYEDQTSTSPGHAVVRALRSLLASGGAHVGTSGQGGPPIPSTDKKYGSHAMELNQQLGWQFPADSKESPRPGGRLIGIIAKNPKSDEWSIIFDANTAFKEAQRAYPELILHGSRPAATWNSAWAEELCTPEDVGWTRKRTGAGVVREIVRVRGHEGIPIPLNRIALIPSDDE